MPNMTLSDIVSLVDGDTSVEIGIVDVLGNATSVSATVDGRTLLLCRSGSYTHDLISDLPRHDWTVDDEGSVSVIRSPEGEYVYARDVSAKMDAIAEVPKLFSLVPRYDFSVDGDSILPKQSLDGIAYRFSDIKAMLNSIEPSMAFIEQQSVIRKLRELLYAISVDYPDTLSIIGQSLERIDRR